MPWSWKRNAAPRKSREEKQREYTEQIAYELYQNRVLLGKAGDAHNDWQTAERIVKNPVKTTLFASHRPFIKLEKRLWEPLLRWADNQALLSLLGIIGNVGLILAVVTYVGSEKQRRDAEVRNAWQTITSAHGQAGSGGRKEALEFLNASPGANWRRRFPWFCAPHPWCTWPREPLSGINLGVELEDDVASEARPTDTGNEETPPKPTGNQSTRVYLVRIQLPNAFLESANLEGAVLESANLEGAVLESANLEGAVLSFVNLEGAALRGANLEGAVLSFVNLEGADLRGANLEGADLGEANLERADLSLVNLEGSNTITEKQLTETKLCRTQLPNRIQLEPNRDCEELGIDPATGRPLFRELDIDLEINLPFYEE